MKSFLIGLLLCAPMMAQTPPAAPAPAASAAPAAAAPAAPSATRAATESPVPADDENWLTGFIDLGYRWLPVQAGSLNTYRSVVDLNSGPRLLATEFMIRDLKHRLFDRIEVRAYDIGDDPNETIHVGVNKSKLYSFSADYRNIAYYNNLPGYADPLLATSGVVLNEQSLATRQKIGSYRLDLLPGRRIVPYLIYERDSDSGTGVGTFVSGGDEFPVVNLTGNSTNNYRGGVRVELSRLHLTLEEGGTTFADNQQLNQSAGQTGYGNFTTPLFGQTLDLTGLSENYRVRGSSTYSRGLLTANVTSWLDLYGQFLYSEPSSNVNFSESSAGNQVVLSEVLFYTGEQSLITAESKMPHTSASFGAEIRPFRRLRLQPSWLTDRMHVAGGATDLQKLTTANGLAPVDTLLSSALGTNDNQAGLTAMYDLNSKITLRAGYRYQWGDASDIVLPAAGLASLDQGKIRQTVLLGGIAWRPLPKLSLNTDFENGSSGSTYFRTSLYNYWKARGRGRYQLTTSLSLGASASMLTNHDPLPGLHHDFFAHQESASILYSPPGGKIWDFEGSYTRSTLRSNISYLDPEFLITEQSFYRDNSHTVTALFGFNFPGWLGLKTKFSFGGSAFLSTGSNPTVFYQPTAKGSVRLNTNISWIGEWRYYGFGESFYGYQGFRTQMLMTGVRITR